jgi:uncharacterized protein YcnI
MRRSTVLAATAAAALAVPVAAQAHVTIQPKEIPAGSFARVDVRVPNERDDAGTTKVEVQMPDGIASTSYEAEPGWRIRVVMEEAAEPIDLHGEEVTEQVDRVIFTGDGKRGIIRPGEFKDFGLSVRTPDGEPGETITFKALQTYESGEIVRWIGPEDGDEPAPTVTLAAPPEEGHAAPAEEPAEEVEPAPASAPADDDDGGDGLAIAALIVGGLGLVAGLAGLISVRRSRSEQGGEPRVATQP